MHVQKLLSIDSNVFQFFIQHYSYIIYFKLRNEIDNFFQHLKKKKLNLKIYFISWYDIWVVMRLNLYPSVATCSGYHSTLIKYCWVLECKISPYNRKPNISTLNRLFYVKLSFYLRYISATPPLKKKITCIYIHCFDPLLGQRFPSLGVLSPRVT